MNRITQSVLVQMIAARTELDINIVKKVIMALVEIIKECLLDKKAVILKGFVRFKVEKVSERRQWDLASTQVVNLPERHLPKTTFSNKFMMKVRSIK